MQATPSNLTPFQSASLYVGDLQPEVTESSLFDMFSRVGPVASIRVCRDSVSRNSLGYAYVNFQQVQDAERALDTLNFTEINSRPCRIMWSQRDPSLRKTGLGNVFVRNLAPSVDNKGLYDTFSVFGNILSCKVATDETGKSKGYGYVHFETAEAAQDAIQKFNGMLIDDVEVHVGHFVRRDLRAGQNDWTNLYFKQFPLTWEEQKLREMFEPYGTILSLSLSVDTEGKSKGFGFVNFSEHEAAAKAVAELNGKAIEDASGNFSLYVGKAQKKAERVRELKSRQEHERVTKFQGMNLYVKNISDSVSDETFREAFAVFGNITSARIMREANDAKTSKGFGFVCYTNADDAAKALNEMNGKNFHGKPLFVTFYQRKEQRRAALAANYAPQGMRYPQGMQSNMPMYMYMPGQSGFPNQPRGNVPFYNGQAPRGAANMARGAPAPFNNRNQGYYPPFTAGQASGAPMQGGQFKQPRPNGPGFPQMAPNAAQMAQGAFPGPQGAMGRRPMGQVPQVPGQMQVQQARPPFPPQQMFPAQQQAVRGVPAPASGIKFNNQARNQNGQMAGMGMPAQQMMMQQPMPGAAQSFSEALLATTDPAQQKNMIGERLYPLVYQRNVEHAGKITGMLLEMDNSELIHLIESPEALESKIQEALSVLRNHAGQA